MRWSGLTGNCCTGSPRRSHQLHQRKANDELSEVRHTVAVRWCIGPIAGCGVTWASRIKGGIPALAAGPPTIVDNGSMAPWIAKVAGSNFTPSNFAWDFGSQKWSNKIHLAC